MTHYNGKISIGHDSSGTSLDYEDGGLYYPLADMVEDSEEQQEANANRLIICWNNHDKLLGALQDLIKAWDVKMGKSAVKLRIDIARDLIREIGVDNSQI